MQNIKTVIDSGWEFAERLSPGRDFVLPEGGEKLWLAAQVPGHVHLDLMRNGVIGDPFYRMNERGCAWVDEADWTYRTTFLVDAERMAARGEHGRHFLHFHGLDTICRVYPERRPYRCAENFFIPHRFDVTETLREGENVLRVEFDSALRVGRERAEAYLGDGTSTRGRMAYFNFAPRAFIRKPQYSFGWDWGPELVSCGIWRNITLETVPAAEIMDWQWTWRNSGDERIELMVTAEIRQYEPTEGMALLANLRPANWYRWADAAPRQVEQEVAVSAASFQRVTLRLSATKSALAIWNMGPRDIHADYGPNQQPLYQLSLSLLPTSETTSARRPIHRVNVRIGFRHVELIREPDADGKGEGMKFRINGADTFIKGANWIPDHSFPALITPDRLKQRLMQARDAGFNMLRIWGGGLYESDNFYNLCDELGILVWQDFPFACSSYPDDLPEFREQVRQEAVVAVRRIRNHPCLALWCGGNENIELFQGRWNGDKQATKFFGDRLIHETLPAVLAEEDPNTPYLPNSPYGGENVTSEDYGDSPITGMSGTPNTPAAPVTGQTTRFRPPVFRRSLASPPLPDLLAWDSCMAPEDKTVSSPVFQWHDKTRKGNETYLNYIRMHYPDPQTFEDLVYYGQCNQADAFTFGVEHWRRLKGRCWGTLFWQLNDCWPTHSWAVIDSTGDPKAAYYAAKRFYAPLLLSLYRNGDVVEAHLVNDGLEAISGQLTLRLLSFDGEELQRRVGEATAPANAASGSVLMLTTAANREAFVQGTFRAPDGSLLAENFQLLAEPKDLRLPDPMFTITTTAKGKDFEVTVSAARFARYIWLTIEGITTPAKYSDNFFHLAPGQTRRIAINALPASMTAEELKARLRLRWR